MSDEVKIFDDTQETEINNFLSSNDYKQIITTADKVIIVREV